MEFAMPIPEVLITALVGFLIVFAVLVILMFVIKIMAFASKSKNTDAPATATATNKDTANAEKAPGSCGGLVLKNVSDKDAAMIMAIVADELKTPLCELRFKSIKLEEDNNK